MGEDSGHVLTPLQTRADVSEMSSNRELPPCFPWVFGYALTDYQVTKVAERLCTAEELSRSPDFPDVCLNHRFHRKGIQQAFLSYTEDDVPYHLWIHGVFPSFDGSEPNFTIPPLDLTKLPCMKGLGDVKNKSLKWPVRHLTGAFPPKHRSGSRTHSAQSPTGSIPASHASQSS